jgi:cell division protein FtsQ
MSMLNRKRNNRRAGSRTRRFALELPSLNWGRLSLSLSGLAIVAVALLTLGWLLDQPIQRVIVTGRLQRVSAMDVEKVVRARLAGAGLISVNLAGISHGLAQLPWVESAAVERSWPRGLKIEIFEQTAVARWNGTALLNVNGDLFISEPRFVPPELPALTGPAGSEEEVTQRYLGTQGRLTEIGMRLAALDLDARGAWNLTLDNGVIVRLGRQRMNERFDRFMVAAAKLVIQRATDIAYVDMRYSNGFAVGWKGGVAHATEHSGEHAASASPDHSDG